MSEWQGNINWNKVKSSGVDYAILRAGFGRDATQKDSSFEANLKNAAEAGVSVGVYWYSYAVDADDAVKEAEACIKVLDNRKVSLPVFYDMEENSQTKLGKAQLTAMAEAFMNRLLKAGYKVGIYANANWFENYLDYKKLFGKYYIWLAQYNDVAEFECDIWQHTSEAVVSGVQGYVDMNIIYSDKLVKSKPRTEPADNFETAGLQALLMVAERLGIITQTISPLDNKKGIMTKSAIKQMKKALNMTEDEVLSLQFFRKTYQAVVDALPVSGDVNMDGKINVRDVTELQRRIAGVEDV